MLQRSRAVLCFFFILAGPALCWAQNGQGPSGAGVFFSQGQAVYNTRDLAKSQQAAIQDLLVQGATQALGTFLTPQQMGRHFAALQDHILQNPQQYVQSYQLFSEKPVNGLYRVVGEVTIDMQALRGDLQKLGLTLSQTLPAKSAGAAQQPSSVTEPMPAAHAAEGSAPNQEQGGGTAGAMKILWAVAERSGDSWILAHGGNDRETVFAMSVVQESQDYDWSLVFPATGALTPGADGNVAQSAAIALAKQLGASAVVTGFVALAENPIQGPVLKTTLQVLDVATDQTLGEMQKVLPLHDTAFQEGIIDLAAAVMPPLDSMLRYQARSAGTGPSTPAGGGEWTLIMQGDQRQACWAQLEQLLRERYQSLQVKSIEFGPQQTKIHLTGLDSNFYNVLSELQLPNGAQMQVNEYAPKLHAVEVTTGTN